MPLIGWGPPLLRYMAVIEPIEILRAYGDINAYIHNHAQVTSSLFGKHCPVNSVYQFSWTFEETWKL